MRAATCVRATSRPSRERSVAPVTDLQVEPVRPVEAIARRAHKAMAARSCGVPHPPRPTRGSAQAREASAGVRACRTRFLPPRAGHREPAGCSCYVFRRYTERIVWLTCRRRSKHELHEDDLVMAALFASSCCWRCLGGSTELVRVSFALVRTWDLLVQRQDRANVERRSGR